MLQFVSLIFWKFSFGNDIVLLTFYLNSLQTFFSCPITFANNLFCIFRPSKIFLQISHSPLQKNNGPSFTMFLSCSKSINSLPGSFTRIFLLVGKSHFLFYQNSYQPYVSKSSLKAFSRVIIKAS